MTTAYKRNGKFLGRLQDGVFVKDGAIENKHLLHSYGDVPAIDKKAYEANIPKEIVIKTDKRTFYSTGKNFEEHKFKIDHGFGEQLTMDAKHWTITNKNENKLPL